MKNMSNESDSVIQPMVISIIGVSVFSLLPIVLPIASSFSYVVVFVFTVFFIFKGLFSNRSNITTLQLKLLYIVLLFWTIVVFFRGFSSDYNFLRSLVISPYVFLPYIFPFFIRHFSILDLRKILLLINYTNIIYLGFIILFLFNLGGDFLESIGFIEDLNKYFAFPNFLMLFFFFKLTKREKLLSLSVFFLGFLMSIYTARRSLTWTFGWAFVLFLLLIYTNMGKSLLKKIKFVIFLSLIGLSLFFVYQKYEESLFGNLLAKIDADTRSTVLTDFDNDMNTEDLIFGKGINGSYLLRETDKQISESYLPNRNLIEVGYLNIVLKGGYIHLFLFIIIYLIAIFKGFFKSKNNYSKAFACFILLYVFESYPAGVMMFNFRFLLIWFCVAVCWDKQFLKLSDSQLNSILVINK